MRQMIVPLIVVVLLLGLFIPLPVVMIDYLVVANLCLALLLLLSVLFVDHPVKLSTLPSFLLLATLFRLMTNIATTRQLLTDGTPGNIIPLVGESVISGSVVVGLVIFLIVTLVQLIVISKGAERVAEVSARFTLDAMPGKQMSIDADVRSGLIDLTEARKRRNDLQIESRFYGALDGSMKFVKGDAIVGILIILVNIIGGLFTGMFFHSLSLMQAVNHYTLMTVGDGILSQVPAVLNSVAAGIVITRVVSEEGKSLSGELVQQLMSSQPVKLIIASLALFFACLPGVPAWPFICVAVLFVSFLLIGQPAQSDQSTEFQAFSPEPISLYELQLREQDLTIVEEVRKNFFNQTGLILPYPKLELSEEQVCKLYLRGMPILEITEESKLKNLTCLANEVSTCLEGYILDLMDDRLTRLLLDQYEKSSPELVLHLIPEHIGVTELTCLLKDLSKESINLKNFDLILQAVSENVKSANDHMKLLAKVRMALKRQITNQYAHQGDIQAITIAPEIDFEFYKAQTEGTEFKNESLELILKGINQIEDRIKNTVFLCSTGARKIIRDCLWQYNLDLPVLAYEEINREIKIKSLLHIEANNV